jgi:hypothetical protein
MTTPPPSGYPAYPDPRDGDDFASVMHDPLVPLDFGGWFQRVFGVFRRSFKQLAAFSVVPAALFAVYLIVLNLAMPSPEQIRQRLDEAGVTPYGAVNPMVGYEMILPRLLPIILVFAVIMTVVGAYYQGASLFVAVRDANGQPSTAAEGLRFAGPRVLPFIGWSLLTWVIFAVALTASILLGALFGVLLGVVQVGIALGFIVFAILGTFLVVVIFPSFAGVVLIERAGLKRCFQLIRDRFWATFGRLLVVGLLYIGYSIALGLVIAVLVLVAGATGLPSTGSLALLVLPVVEMALAIPFMVFIVAVYLVTYAELRFRENPATSTPSLAAELAR